MARLTAVGEGASPASRNTGTSSAAGTAALAERIAAAWPLVGHDDTRGRIASALKGTDKLRGAVLTGEAGVGKSRLARESLRDAAARGWATEWIVATASAASMPLGAFGHLLPPIDAGSSELVDLVRHAVRTLGQRAGDRPLVVGIDDVHLLDAPSAALVHQLATTGRAYVVMTTRSRAVVPDAVSALWRDGVVNRLEVPALTEDDVHALLPVALQGDVEPTVAHRLWELTRGNALFLHELVLSGVESGAFAREKGRWVWAGPMAEGSRVREVVEERLARLDDTLREALGVLAIGEPLGVGDFENIAGIETVDHLERLELLEAQRDTRRETVRVAHPLYAEVLRASLPSRRARAIRRRLAALVESRGIRRREDVLRVALWRMDAGGEVDAPLLVRASRHAAGAFDYALSERLGRAALANGGGTAAATVLAEALRALGRPLDAERVWAAIEVDGGDVEQRVDVAIARSVNLFFGLGRAADASTVLAEAAPGAGVETGAVRHAIGLQQSMFRLYTADPIGALAVADEVDGADDASDAARVEAATSAAPALAVLGLTATSLERVDRWLPVAFTVPDTGPFLAGMLMAARYLALSLHGRLREGLELAVGATRLSLEAGSTDGVAVFTMAGGQALLTLGRAPDAADRLAGAAVMLRERDRNRYLPWCLAELAMAHALMGEVHAARAALAEADAVRSPELRMFDVELEMARAWVRMAEGDEAGAATTALAAAEWAETTGQVAFAIQAFHTVARIGDAPKIAGRASALATRAESPLLTLMARHVDAAAMSDGETLAAVASELATMGASIIAAEVGAQATHLLRASGQRPAAAAAAARARLLLDEMPGVRTPLLALFDDPLPLTAREREIAMLAARGLTSRQIADRVFVSVRTIDNHLHRAYQKLGVSSRAELGQALGVAPEQSPTES